MPSSHPTTIIVAVSSSVLPSKQWDIVKTQLYQCWIQLYGPLFWIVSAMLCFWDSKTTTPYHRITVMEMPPSTTTTTSRHITAATPENINEPVEPENNKANTIVYMSQSDGSNKQHKKSLKRIIKNHIQTIKQRRQSLNEAVKRSVRRRPSQQHNNNNNNRNGLASELHPPTATTHSMPPRRRHSFPGTANMLLKPFRRKTAPAIFNNQK
ncbi:hypothetical protein K492DRAFT_184396 [Lichtheimia hyalospora FSU 10163]|nr:hypothetical protein K492DRAFT_184396 [Lichtheimia hyalospora FSU 10163]